MRARAFVLVLFSALASLIAPASMQAAIVTFNFTGSVSSVYDPFNLVGSLIEVGDPVSASLRYVTTTPDGDPADPTRGVYISPGWLKVDIKGLDFEKTSTIQVDVAHGFVADTSPQEFLQVLVLHGTSAWPSQLPIFTYTLMGLFAAQSTPPFSLFLSDALPSSIDFSKADIFRGSVGSSTDDLNMYEIQFALSPVPVPEPASAPLLGAAVLLLCLPVVGRRLTRCR